MRQPLAAILICPLLLAGPSAAEQPDDAARILAALNDSLRSTLHETRARQLDLTQRLEILNKLLEGIEAISLQGGSLQVAGARRKLEDARDRASRPAAAGRPVPEVLDAVGELLDRPPFGATPERLRGLACLALEPLETNAVELEEGLWRWSGYLSSVRENLVQAEAGLRASWLGAVRLSIEARRVALGLPPSLRPPQPASRQPFRTPRSPEDLRDLVRAYVEDLQVRQYDLARRSDVLLLLVVGGDAIPLQGAAPRLAEARQKLDAARTIATRLQPLEAPVPAVLERTGRLLDLLSAGPPAPRARGSYFFTLGPLEEDVLALAEGLRAESRQVGAIAASLLEADEGGLRSTTLEGLRSSIRARRAALGLHP